MHDWLYTLRERLTSDMQDHLDGYRAFSGFTQITKLVTLNSRMCPDVITYLCDEDWEHSAHEDSLQFEE